MKVSESTIWALVALVISASTLIGAGSQVAWAQERRSERDVKLEMKRQSETLLALEAAGLGGIFALQGIAGESYLNGKSTKIGQSVYRFWSEGSGGHLGHYLKASPKNSKFFFRNMRIVGGAAMLYSAGKLYSSYFDEPFISPVLKKAIETKWEAIRERATSSSSGS
jgi:hypothetical protein